MSQDGHPKVIATAALSVSPQLVRHGHRMPHGGAPLSAFARQGGLSFRVTGGDVRDHAARALHLGFYATPNGQAAVGLTASYLTVAVALLHVIGSEVILAMLGLHIAVAVHAARRDGAVGRMLSGRRRAAR